MLPQIFFFKSEPVKIKKLQTCECVIDISKIFGRIMHKQMSLHFDHFLSPYL